MMDIVINPEISLLMETADLVCAYVNGLSPEILTADKPCFIPAPEIGKIMEQACDGLDREDQRLQFYFQSFPERDPDTGRNGITSLGQKLVYTSLLYCGQNVQECRERFENHILCSGTSFKITGDGLGIGFVFCDEYRSVANELKLLDIPDDLRMRLVEAFSNFRYHIMRLYCLLEPVAQKLLPLLLPWWEKMAPVLEMWRTALNTEKQQRLFRDRANINMDEVRSVYVSLRIFRTQLSVAKYEVPANVLYWSVSLDTEPEKKAESLCEVKNTALRLLSSNDRIEILRAMAGRVMTPKELAKELNMNPGTVFRCLNSLNQEHLVTMVIDGVHRSYTTNGKKLKRVVHDLLEYILNENA